MKKHLKPVITSIMVLTLGVSLSACGQSYTTKQNALRTKDHMIDGNLATRDNRFNSNSMNNRANTLNPMQESEGISNRARKVVGVKEATAVVNNNQAVVGIDVDNTGKKAIIEKQVYAALKGQYPQYDIHVTSEQNLHHKIRSLNTNMSTGHPIKTLANDVALIIRDIGETVTMPLR